MVYVAPFAGAWIEIARLYASFRQTFVAPFAGAWIEISKCRLQTTSSRVAPFAGAWIEIIMPTEVICTIMSLPSRERGLKWYVYVG